MASQRTPSSGNPPASFARPISMDRPPWFDAHLTPAVFERLRRLIESHLGIRSHDAKLTMVECRLRSRLRDLNIHDFAKYADLLERDGEGGPEFVHFIDRITTNKTDFFREPQHFEFLVQEAIPNLIRETGAGIQRDLVVWSAACSSGEEPYTLAMVLSEFQAKNLRFRFSILGTDISTEVLAHAQQAIYAHDRVEPIPLPMRAQYLLQSKDKSQNLVRISPALRQHVTLRRLNLMDADYGIAGPVDVIFCRNVFIYFDRPTQERIIQRFCRHLVPGGYLFFGHAEALTGRHELLKPVGSTTYRHLRG